MKIRGRSARGGARCLVLFGCIVGLAPFASPGASAESGAAEPDPIVSRFRIGPFFEHRVTRDGGTFWAVRPFWVKDFDAAADTRVADAVWPLATFHRDREQSWWRVLLAYGNDTDSTREDAAWSAALFPFWYQGRTRQGEDYKALFPLYGHLPHMLLMDDIDFCLFPVHLNYTVRDVEREYYLWPIFSHTGDHPDVERTGVFPLYGRTKHLDEDHLYVLWPLWNSATYGGERNPGSSWMLFPLCGRVDRAKEQQRLFIPPFFSHVVTDSAERRRMPWPFIETLTTPTSSKRSFWPVYGVIGREDEQRWYAAWPLIEHFNLVSKGRRTERSRFFPFYVDQTLYRTDKDGREYPAERYTRVWPFFARETTPTRSHLHALELSLIRYSGGIERNWAPFWTFYERTEQGGEVTRDALWGLLQSHRAASAEGSEP